MKKGIDLLNKLYMENGAAFLMSITYLCQIGFQRAEELTDKEIQSVKENTSEHSIISPELNEFMMKTAREISRNATEVTLFQWLQVNKPYDTYDIKKAR